MCTSTPSTALLRTANLRRLAVCVVVVATLGAAAPAHASGAHHTTVVNVVPSAATPNVNDGTVLAITRVGSRVVLGGDFTSVSPPGARAGAGAIPRRSILAFDAGTGRVDGSFAPDLSGEVEGLSPGPSADTVYVAGSFSTVNGVPADNVALLDLTTGRMVGGFSPPRMNGSGWAVRRSGGHLLVAGTFTTVGGAAHAGLVSLDPATGALQPYVDIQLAGHHSYRGLPGQAKAPVGARRLDISSDGTRMVVVGNFTSADGLPRDQLLMVRLGGSATVDPTWATAGYTAICGPTYDTYVRDVSFSADGSYFVVATTGGGGIGARNTDGTRSLCDTAARWPTAASGVDISPTWINRTGNDSLESVTTAGAVVYVGGHQRWLNNSFGEDSAGPGAVPRPGLAALDPTNGLPLRWNPGRNPRGAGAYALLATAQGLYVGSDTTFIGNRTYYRGRIASFPLAGGTPLPSTATASLPGRVYAAGPAVGAADALLKRPFNGTTAGAATAGPASSTDWGQVRGSVLVGNQLFYGFSDGQFYRRSFSGSSLGAQMLVDPYDDPFWSDVQTGSGNTYRGQAPSLYGSQMQQVTGMVFRTGKLFYSLRGQQRLRWRWFTPESGIVGSEEFVAGGDADFSSVAGLFLSGQKLFYAAGAGGALHSVTFDGGAPKAASDRVANSAVDWRARGLFVSAS